MFQQILLAVIGFSSGVIIAGGVVGLLIGLSIVPRYAGSTYYYMKILLYLESSLAIFSLFISGIFRGERYYSSS